jgi:hypothetical protein
MKLIMYTANTAFGLVDALEHLRVRKSLTFAACRARLTTDGEPNLDALAAF